MRPILLETSALYKLLTYLLFPWAFVSHEILFSVFKTQKVLEKKQGPLKYMYLNHFLKVFECDLHVMCDSYCTVLSKYLIYHNVTLSQRNCLRSL